MPSGISPGLAFALGAAAAALVALAFGIWLTRASRARAEAAEREAEAVGTRLRLAEERLTEARADIQQKSVALEAAFVKIERWSLEDELTGLANRKLLHDRLEDELSRTLRRGSPVTLVMLDLDGFAESATSLGEAESDRHLERVGGFLRDRIRRRADLGGRYEGSEFALVLPDTPLNGALSVAESLRAGIEQLGLGGGKRKITASVGVAQASIDGRDRVVDLVHRAEEALDRARREGENRVVAAPTPAVGRP